LARDLPLTLLKSLQYPQAKHRENATIMNRWNDTFERCHPQPADGWAERARRYLRSRTADHWLMFMAGLLLGALLA
jgi:hypothetical protein